MMERLSVTLAAPGMRRAAAAAAIAVAFLVAACGPTPAAQIPDPRFDAIWHDGKAELDGYRYSVTRYGQLRRGRCVAIYVTEPFSRSKRVKVDDPSRNAKDVLDVLKLNLVRDFQTGIYDYNTMTSLFVGSEDLDPVKVSFSSMEWCGNVYEELRVDPGLISQKLSSYFEGESAVREAPRPGNGILEEELFVLLRGLHGEYLSPGRSRTVPFLESAFRRRLAHQPLRWTEARITRLNGSKAITVPAGRFGAMVYTVNTGNGHDGVFFIEDAYPHRIIRWEWKQARRQKQASGAGAVPYPLALRPEGNDSGELTGSARLSYWQLHGAGDESYLKRLGLGVGPEPARASGRRIRRAGPP